MPSLSPLVLKALLIPHLLAQAAPQPAAAEPARRVALAAFTEGALGYAGDGFYNQLAGLRLDYRAGERLALGLSLSYANLKGKNGRAHNVLPAAMLEWHFPLSERVGLPLRFYSGYLPKNGPWLKAALGLSHRVGDRSRITFEAIAPALWVVHDANVGSFDVALEYSVDL